MVPMTLFAAGWIRSVDSRRRLRSCATKINSPSRAQAQVLMGTEAFVVPARLLPDDAIEGSWLRLSLRVAPPPPDDASARRRRPVAMTTAGTSSSKAGSCRLPEAVKFAAGTEFDRLA